ncbi:EAL domain-containing protein [Rheinheimera sp.]|uniref:putative bifunctional diguanylate cyclase/phosphodiesterase n=1 Tax=Rheinheimera sp. TaxID=1869214 RepID=UPI00307F66BA
MFDSLRSRLILTLLSLLTVLAIASGLATLTTMKQDSQQQAEQALQVAANVLLQALENRATQLSNSVRLLASDYGFRRAIATAEQETILSVLDNHGSRVDAALAVLFAPDGQLLASTNPALNSSDFSPFFDPAQSRNAAAFSDIQRLGDESFQLVLVPVRAPQVIAWIGMGFQLDQQLAEQIKGITGLDISFTSAQGRNHSSRNSTLASHLQPAVLAALPELNAGQQSPFSSPDEQYLSLALPLDQHHALWALLHYPTERWQSSYQQIRQQLLTIFGVSLALAFILALVIARSITQPLNRLTQFATAITKGESKVRLPQATGEVGVLSQTLSQMQQAVQQREEQLVHQARHDHLTGLKNRTYAEQELQQLLSQYHCSLILLNIKNFRHINDSLGFTSGDSLLQQVAERLKLVKPAASLLARLGGDEFLMAYPRPFQDSDALILKMQLQQDYHLDGSALSLSFVLGIYCIEADSQPVSDALRRLDIALSRAKQLQEQYSFYQQGQDEHHQRRLTILRDLPTALQSNQLFVVYQPKVDLKQYRCHAAEALIRWAHPELGFIPPDEFIQLAEHAGLINQVTDWMLSAVIRQLALWRSQGIELKVAVNLSAHDLSNPSLPEHIAAILQQHQLPTKALALEVTEGAVMKDPKQVIHILHQLRQMGIELAIDDFGTGQSSLAYLKQLPVHEVKIDRAFVKDIENNYQDELIVSATAQLAHGLGLKVTAEGLENKAGLSILRQHQCDTVQGYFFSKPLTAEQFSSWLGSFSLQPKQWFAPEDL